MATQDRWVLGHFTEQHAGLRRYSTQPLPPRPASGAERITVTCHACGEKLSVEMMSRATQARRQGIKIAAMLASAIGAIILIAIGNSAKENMDNYSYPGWQTPAYIGGAVLALVCVCVLAFVFRNTGTRLSQLYGSPAKVGERDHWLVRNQV